MNLALDFGNTLVKAGLFEHGDLVHFESHRSLSVKQLTALLRRFRIQGAIVSSVVNDSAAVEKFLSKSFHLVKLNPSTALPIKNHYETPGTLGMDRLAGISGANFVFPKKDVLVINAGTCITYDAVTATADYFGGNITPGLDMRLKALNTFTDRLPLVKKQFVTDLFGKSTSSSILTGVVTGAHHEMSGFIAAYRKRYPRLKVVLTGGDAPVFETIAKNRIFAVPNLVLYGLNEILSMNELIKALLFLLVFGAFVQVVKGQTVLPYTRYGLGSLADPEFTNLRGWASVSAAYHDPFHINFANPASYSDLKLTSFEAGCPGKLSYYQNQSGYICKLWRWQCGQPRARISRRKGQGGNELWYCAIQQGQLCHCSAERQHP
jgi:type III pantothenate kinase